MTDATVKPKLMIPTIHLNGTNKEELFDHILNAITAIRRAEAALQGCAPNGRDYYPQGPIAINQAMDQYRARYEMLVSVREELEAIAESFV